MHRRIALSFLALAISGIQAQTLPPPAPSPVDSVTVYVIPTDGMPENVASGIARNLTKETGLWIKSTPWAPADNIEPLAGTNQYPGEDYLAMGTKIGQRLREANARTYFIVLTDKDINSRLQNFRFQFSMHSPMARTSVLSVARLFYEMNGSPAPLDVVETRARKMLLRIVGEMRLGWKRTSDPTDVMFSPIMSVEDIDRMSVVHTLHKWTP